MRKTTSEDKQEKEDADGDVCSLLFEETSDDDYSKFLDVSLLFSLKSGS